MGEETKRGRGRPRTFNRERTIALAMDSYWKEGVQALSLNEVCRRANVSKPALYREFDDEDGLMAAVLVSYRELLLVPFLDALELELPFADVMEMLIVAMTSDRGAPTGCLFTEMRLARSHLGPVTEARLASIELERRRAMEACYQRALQRGEVDPVTSPELASRYLDTQFTALLIQMGMGEPPETVQAQTRMALRVLRAAPAGGEA